jgi:hypothetical protein
VFSVPLFDPISIEGVRMNVITYTIVVIKNRSKLAPSNLSQSVTFQGYFIIEKFLKNCCICSYREKG